MGEFDKGEMVIYYVLISLFLFSILVYIVIVLSLFQCFRVILEGNGKKRAKTKQKKAKSDKVANW